ncbi:hypothetical protein [Nocardioides sp.]|uniref:hypothetical protein n=1 Tax=Nocardioides sp. TaxID=35761 RepID=UPI001A2B44C2|nr:hypothetical protein [Nocardioides sp.]MBJ7355763.1 hypothetical protein [Nocardioides sp.]
MRALSRTLALVTTLALLGLAGPAHAEPRVDVANDDGDAAVDPTYVTSLTLRGSGFQSIHGGHGGIYVFFGTVRAGWRPSQGGQTGVDYFYVPDGESRDNQGFAKFVAFQGSDTAGSANGGTISAAGAWSTTLRVPGATFEAYDRTGGSRTVDCRQVTCGVITVGAHGVANARNESFTPVRVEDLYAAGEQPGSVGVTPAAGSDTPATGVTGPEPTGNGKSKGGAVAVTPTLAVDRGAARAGHVLSFAAAGLPAGAQVTTVLDDGVAGAGPFLVGDDGRVAGVLTLPADLDAGTHELRLFGVEGAPTVSFGVAAGVEVTAATPAPVGESNDRSAQLFVAAAGVLLLLALGRLLLARRRGRHD